MFDFSMTDPDVQEATIGNFLLEKLFFYWHNQLDESYTPRKILDNNRTLAKLGKMFSAVMNGFNIIPGVFQSKSQRRGGLERTIK